MSEDSVQHFIGITGASKYLAEQYLSRNNDEIVDAIEDYYATNTSNTTNTANEAPKKTSTKRGINTFRDLNDGDESDDKTDTNFFTGGEKSALQVEDPNKKDKKSQQSLMDKIIQRAQEQMAQPDDRPSASAAEPEEPKFTGTGFKLGDGTGNLQTINNSNPVSKPNKVTRELTFWRNGFTVGDGPLHRFDDPENASVLQELNRGRVPVSVLNVEFGQDVDVSVIKKNDEDYKPKKKIGGYHGSGQRLGAPVPGEIISNDVEETKPETKTEPIAPEPESDGDSPVQIRFANGKKLSTKLNSTDSILEVYSFVRSHEYNDQSRDFSLNHAFPVKLIEESTEVTVADAQLKGAVIVQRWK